MVLGSSPSGPTSHKYMDSPVQILLDAAAAHAIVRSVEGKRSQAASRLTDFQEKIVRATDQLSNAQSSFSNAQTQMQMLEKQLTALEQQHGQLTAALNSGKVGDYNQGLAQQAQLQNSISNTEDDVLAQIDLLEGIPTQIAEFEEHLEYLKERLSALEAEYAAHEPTWAAEMEVASADMNRHVDRLPETEQRRFWAVRQKHPRLVAPLMSNACGNCYVAIALKEVSLILQRYSVYRCSKCGIFVLEGSLLRGES